MGAVTRGVGGQTDAMREGYGVGSFRSDYWRKTVPGALNRAAGLKASKLAAPDLTDEVARAAARAERQRQQQGTTRQSRFAAAPGTPRSLLGGGY